MELIVPYVLTQFSHEYHRGNVIALKVNFVDCNIAECEIFEFRCQFMGLCMDIVRWCDGYNDCPDNSDEPSNCVNGTYVL